MNATFKQIGRRLAKLAPGPFSRLLAWRQRRQITRFERRIGLPAIVKAYTDLYPLRVLHGPFREMRYVPRAAGSAFIPKLLGSYELELHGVLQGIIKIDYQIVVDVGCAEGYYAVGLARTLSEACVYAFDTDEKARELCAAMARENDVAGRVKVRGACQTATLNDLLDTTAHTLIVCDCEGYEYDLLRPDIVPGLQTVDMLIELHELNSHDGYRFASSEEFLRCFEPTHDITVIRAQDRNHAAYKELEFLPVEQRQLALNEFRLSGQQWAFLKSRAPYATESSF